LEKLKNEELERAKKETADVLEAAEALEKELNDMRAERDQLKTLSEAVPATSNEQIEALQEENRRYLDKII
jgi:Tfp pilus assembly protein PilN